MRTNLARGEWVVRKRAVDSVDNQFMARLNKHGDKALEDLQSTPSIDMKVVMDRCPAIEIPRLGLTKS